MKKIVSGFTFLTIAAWLFGLWLTPPDPNARAIVHEFFFVTGTVAWGWMAIAVVIAARPAWIERVTGVPLDKLYVWHKWLGAAAIALSLLHWFVKPLVAPLLSFFTLEPVPKIVRSGDVGGLAALWAGLRSVAKESSICLTGAAVALGVISYIRKIGYGTWLSTHKFFSIIFLGLTLHSIRLMETADFMTPFGWINIAVTLVGAWYSIKILFFGAGSTKTVHGTVESVSSSDGITVLRIKPDHKLDLQEGAFVFIKTGRESKHPFSVSDIGSDDTVELLIKALGDYTAQCVPDIKAGDSVGVEGGWGEFTPVFNGNDQVWVAAGIGIVPFCAWLKAARRGKVLGNVRLLWCVKSKETEPLYGRVKELCRQAGVTLEVFESRGRRLDSNTLFEHGRPDKLAVCTGEKLAVCLTQAWVKAGGRSEEVMREHFVWR